MARIQPIVVKTTVVLKLNSLVRHVIREDSEVNYATSSERIKKDSDHAVVGRQVGVGWGAARSINFK